MSPSRRSIPASTPALLDVGRRLRVAVGGLDLFSGASGYLPGGGIVEIRLGSNAYGIAVPIVGDAATTGIILDLLDVACSPTVEWTLSRGVGGYRVELRRGAHQKEWGHADHLGVPLAEALIARLSRGRR